MRHVIWVLLSSIPVIVLLRDGVNCGLSVRLPNSKYSSILYIEYWKPHPKSKIQNSHCPSLNSISKSMDMQIELKFFFSLFWFRMAVENYILFSLQSISNECSISLKPWSQKYWKKSSNSSQQLAQQLHFF